MARLRKQPAIRDAALLRIVGARNLKTRRSVSGTRPGRAPAVFVSSARSPFASLLAITCRSHHTGGVEFPWVSPLHPFRAASILVSPTDNLMPRVLLRVATSYIESIHAYRHREMVQSQQGFRLHPARRQVQGRVRAHLGGGARRPRQSQREPEDLLRARARAERQNVRGRFEGGLTARRPSLADPQMCYRDRSKEGASWPCTGRSAEDI